jgi:hypothetical protein
VGPKVTYRFLALAGAIVAFGIGLAVILRPGPSLREFAVPAVIFGVGCIVISVIDALGRHGRRGDPMDKPVSAGVAHGITNTVVVIWLALIALLAWLAYSTKPSLATGAAIAALGLSILVGGYLLARKWKTGSLLPYGVAAVVSVIAVMGCFALALALRGG